MKKWMSGFRGAAIIIVLWVIGWGLGFGGIMEAIIDPDGKIGDIWPTMLAIPGFIGGLIFSALILTAERGGRFDQLSLARVALWGVVTGLLLGLLTIPAEVGDVSPGALGMTGIAIFLSLLAAIGTTVFFKLLSWWKPETASE